MRLSQIVEILEYKKMVNDLYIVLKVFHWHGGHYVPDKNSILFVCYLSFRSRVFTYTESWSLQTFDLSRRKINGADWILTWIPKEMQCSNNSHDVQMFRQYSSLIFPARYTGKN